MSLPVIVATVDGSARILDRDDFEIAWSLGQRPVGHLTIPDVRFDPWDAVSITIDGTVVFAGFVQDPSEAGPIGGETYFSSCPIVGREAYLDRRALTESYAAGSTLADIVGDLHTKYLASTGITLAALTSPPVIGAIAFERAWLGEASNQLATAANWLWEITPAGVWTWTAAGAVAAPFDVTDASNPCDGDITREVQSSDYANFVYVFAGDADTPIVATASDATEIAARGQFDALYTAPNVTDSATAQVLADAYLAIRKVPRTVVRYSTQTPGLRPGMAQTITIAARNLSGSFLIQDVTLTTPGGVPTYAVTATSLIGPVASWADTYRLWSGGGTSALQVALASGGAGSVSVYPLGGSTALATRSAASPAWQEPADAQIARIDGTGFAGRVATAVVSVWAEAAGVGVTPRVWNLTTGAAAGTGTKATTQTRTVQTILLSLASGVNTYALELLADTGSQEVYGQGYVEIH